MICAGDNFFKPASYTIEALCAKTYEDTTDKLKDIEAQILRKRNELRQFETEYRKVLLLLALFTTLFTVEVVDMFLTIQPLFLSAFRHWQDFKKSPIDIVRKSSL